MVISGQIVGLGSTWRALDLRFRGVGQEDSSTGHLVHCQTHNNSCINSRCEGLAKWHKPLVSMISVLRCRSVGSNGESLVVPLHERSPKDQDMEFDRSGSLCDV